MKNTAWPKTVPHLAASDICKRVFTVGAKHCLSGWANVIFGGGGFACWASLHPLTVETVRAALMNRIKRIVPTAVGISTFNDVLSKDNRQIAKVWNDAMNDLGYTEVS